MSGKDVINYVKRENLGNGNNNQDSYLLLSHRWQTNLGDFEINQNAFPNPIQFINELRKMGVSLALTITPFISTSSSNFLTGVEQGLFISEPSRASPPDGMEHDASDIENYPRTITPALTSYKVFKKAFQIK